VVIITVLSDAAGLNVLLRERTGNKLPWTCTVKIITKTTLLLFTPILFYIIHFRDAGRDGQSGV
jgi:hypothetical protein